MHHAPEEIRVGAIGLIAAIEIGSAIGRGNGRLEQSSVGIVDGTITSWSGIADVAETIVVCVALVAVGDIGTVIKQVRNAITVRVRIRHCIDR